MDPCDSLNVRFHFGGEFLGIGPELQYVGGDEAMSNIERASLCMMELKAHLSEHMNVKTSMKYYFLLPGKEMVNGLLFLNDDLGCKKISDMTTDGGVAEVFIEYHGEEDEEEDDEKSGSDFENEIGSGDDKEDTDISEHEVVLTADASIVFSGPSKLNMDKSTTLNMFRRGDRKSTRLNSSHITRSRMPSSA